MVTINHKGNWVNASKIEKKLLSHKDIEDCYVVALGDIQVGQNSFQWKCNIFYRQSRR